MEEEETIHLQLKSYSLKRRSTSQDPWLTKLARYQPPMPHDLNHHGVRVQKDDSYRFQVSLINRQPYVIHACNLQAKSKRFTSMEPILSFTNIEKNSRHLRIAINPALPTSLL